jgi:aryl-alcohol dehydrogenase-like predicted oxidoreductase
VHPVRAVQNEYSLWTRAPELGLIQACAELGTAFVPFSPLARGALGHTMLDPFTLPETEFRRQIPRFYPENWPRNRALIEGFRAYAADRALSPAALALAWILDQGDHLIPIPGTRFGTHALDWIGAADIDLTDEDRRMINQLLPVGWAYGDRYNHDQASTVERYC